MLDQFGIYRLTGVFPWKLRKVSIESPILLPVRSSAGHHKARREKQTASGAPSQCVSIYPSLRRKPTGERVASCLLNPRKKRNVKTTGCGFIGVICQMSGLQEVTALSHKQTWPWIVKHFFRHFSMWEKWPSHCLCARQELVSMDSGQKGKNPKPREL